MPIYEEVKKLQESHDSWGFIKKALLEKYDYEESKGQGKGVFDQWVTSSKTHQSAMHTFLILNVVLLNCQNEIKD